MYIKHVLGQPFVKRFALSYRTIVMYICPVLSCLSCLSVCDVIVLWPNDWMDQDEAWHGGKPRPGLHCVRWGTSPPGQFSAHVRSGQTAGWTKMPLGSMEAGLGPDNIVSDGDPAPLPKQRVHSILNFLPMYCRQTAGWIRCHLVWS